MRGNVAKYGGCALFTAALAWLYVVLNTDGEAVGSVLWFRLIANAFTIPGCLMLMVGFLIWLTNQGVLDGVGFVTKTGLRLLIPGKGLKQPESYADYVKRKREKKIHGYSFLFWSGAAALAVSIVFIVLFYTAA